MEKTRRVVVETENGPRYVRSGHVDGVGNFAGLTLTLSKRWAAKYQPVIADDVISAINLGASRGLYPEHRVQFAR